MKPDYADIVRGSDPKTVESVEIISADCRDNPKLGFITCPVCDCDNVHHQDESVTIEAYDYEAAPKMRIRGSVIGVPMWCEDGHAFVVCFGFHKGTTYTWCAPHNEKVDDPWFFDPDRQVGIE